MMSTSHLHMHHTYKYMCSCTVKHACIYIYTYHTIHTLKRERIKESGEKREDRKVGRQGLELIVKHQNGFKVATSTQNRLCIVYKELVHPMNKCIFSDIRCPHLKPSPSPQRWGNWRRMFWFLCKKQWLYKTTRC